MKRGPCPPLSCRKHVPHFPLRFHAPPVVVLPGVVKPLRRLKLPPPRIQTHHSPPNPHPCTAIPSLRLFRIANPWNPENSSPLPPDPRCLMLNPVAVKWKDGREACPARQARDGTCRARAGKARGVVKRAKMSSQIFVIFVKLLTTLSQGLAPIRTPTLAPRCRPLVRARSLRWLVTRQRV